MFDPIEFLEAHDIEYYTHGKNVTRNWINIQCPFCYDHSNHCGWNLESTLFNCWICGEKGGPEKLIQTLLNCSFYEAKKLVEEFDEDLVTQKKIDKKKSSVSINIIPKEATKEIPYLHTYYLTKRGFNPFKLREKYDLWFSYTLGRYKYRIIAPVKIDGDNVTFTARDVSGKQEKKYLNLPNDESLIPIKHCVYNIDSVKRKAVIVEGITDVWRIGDGAIATFGTNITDAQKNLIASKKLKFLYILYDSDAKRQAEKVYHQLSPFSKITSIIELDSGDPDTMSENDLEILKGKLRERT